MRRPAFVALAALLAAGGCKESLEPSTSAWQATLAPRGGPSAVRGSVAAVSEGVHTRANLAVSNAEEGRSFAWEIREGTCSDAAAARVGGRAAYPEFRADSLGAGNAQATVSENLRGSRTYHAVLLEPTEARAVVACGALEQRSFSTP